MRYVLPIALLLAAGPAFAAETADVRMGTHDGFGRVVFEFTAPTPFKLDRDGDAVVLHFTGAGTVPAASGASRNIAGVAGGEGMATVTVVPGAKLRTMRLGNRVVLDVLDPASDKQAAATKSAARPKPAARPVAERATPAAAQPAPPQPAAPPPAMAAAPPVAAPPAPLPVVVTPGAIAMPAPVIPVVRDAPPAPAEAAHGDAPATPATPPATPSGAAEPMSLAASHAPLPAGETGSAALLPFGPTVAAAAFRHRDEAWVVFDERRPLDMAALADDPLLSTATVQLLPQATLMRFKAAADQTVRMEHKKEGWAMTLAPKAAAAAPLVPVSRPARLLVPATGLGQVVTVPNPDTGQNLLVGTMLAAGSGVPVAYRVPEFSILPSWQGVIVEPLSDRTQLRSVKEGFAVETGDALAPPADQRPRAGGRGGADTTVRLPSRTGGVAAATLAASGRGSGPRRPPGAAGAAKAGGADHAVAGSRRGSAGSAHLGDDGRPACGRRSGHRRVDCHRRADEQPTQRGGRAAEQGPGHER